MIQRLVALGLAATGCLALSSSWPALANQGWRMEQTSDFLGPITVMVSPRAIKYTITRYGLTFFMSAPKYKIVGINDKTHCYWQEDYAVWSQRAFQRGGDLDKTPAVLDGSETVGGLKTKRYLVQSRYASTAPKGPVKDGKTYNSEMFVCPEIHVPRQFVGVLMSVTYLPSNLGMPLRIIRHTQMGGRNMIWDTHGVKRADVPENLAIPKGYKPVPTEMALFVGGGAADFGEQLTAGSRRSGSAGTWTPEDRSIPPLGVPADRRAPAVAPATVTTVNGFKVHISPPGQVGAPHHSGEWVP